MQIEQKRWTEKEGFVITSNTKIGRSANLVFVFGATHLIKSQDHILEIRKLYPNAVLFGCSTAGEICGARVFDNSLVVTAVKLEHTQIQGSQIKVKKSTDSFQVGEQLARSLKTDGLSHVMVLSEGLNINGSDLVKGLTGSLPKEITLTGGLSGDGERFGETFVLYNDFSERNAVAVLGLYGSRLKVGYGSLGGWDPFGPERQITRSEGNILYELDGKSALELYKTYLGEHAKGLPATGLLFPLALRAEGEGTSVVRTILSVDETRKSLVFAGDVPVGSYARLMKANFDRLIDGASDAAKTSCASLKSSPADLAILISCVGRKMVLKQRTEEEVEAVRDVLGDSVVLTGFYSYGEISPFTPSAKCELHNQTMTITTLSER